MPAIAAFLKGTVSESLTKLVQPAGLVPATFFVLLNLAFIYPTTLADDVGIAKSFSGLAGVWQTVVVAALIFAIGYLLLNSVNIVTEALSGENWQRSILYGPLVEVERIRRSRLERRLQDAGPEANQTEIRWRLATHFPPRDTGTLYLAPTRLGNVLAATQQTLNDRYGIDMASLWAPLEAAKVVKDSPALAAVKDERSTLDLLVNMIFILALFAVEGLAFFGLRRRWPEALLSLLVLPVAFIAYRVAVRAARTWGDSVIVAFDLHRDELRKALGLREPAGFADERMLWTAATGFYLPGADDVDAGEIFDPTVATVTVTQPASLAVTTVSSAVVDVGGEPESGQQRIVLRAVNYVLLVARVGEAARFSDADVVVSDTRVVAIADSDVPAAVRHGIAGARASSKMTDAGARVLWRVSRLGEGGSLTLDYALPLWLLTAEPAGSLPARAVIDGKNGFRLVFSAAPANTVLVVTAMTPVDVVSPPRLLLGNEPKHLDPDPDIPRVYRSEPLTLGSTDPVLSLVLP